jgi:hypothetical protein
MLKDNIAGSQLRPRNDLFRTFDEPENVTYGSG